MDTKYEFGKGSDGAVLLIDEVIFLWKQIEIHEKVQLDVFNMNIVK